MPFDANDLTVAGEPAPLVEGVQVNGGRNWAHYAVADDGTLVYLPSSVGSAAVLSLVWVDRQGREEPAVAEPRSFQEFSLSPDGTRVAVRVSDGDRNDVWIFDLNRNTNTRLTFEDDPSESPTWTPDGTRVAFGSPPAWKAADGTGEVEPLSESPETFPQSFSPDGGVLVVSTRAGGRDLGVVALDGDGTVMPLLQEEFNVGIAALSPDGRWIAYQSDETGQFEIYVRPFPTPIRGAGKYRATVATRRSGTGRPRAVLRWPRTASRPRVRDGAHVQAGCGDHVIWGLSGFPNDI